MADQQFCLKWNNHQGNLVGVFDNLLSKGSLVDVTLACEGNSIKAHKIVLSACSPFFEELFQNNPCQHPIVIMKDLKYEDMKTIVQFMYKGEVNVTQDRLSILLKTAENLKIKGLTEFGSDNQSPTEPSLSQPSIPEKPSNSPPSTPRSGRILRKTNNQTYRDAPMADFTEACSPEVEEVTSKASRNSPPQTASTSSQLAFTSDEKMEFNVPKSTFSNSYGSDKDSNQQINSDSFRMDMATTDFDSSSFPKRVKMEKVSCDEDEDIPSPNWTQSSSHQYQDSSFNVTSESQQPSEIIKSGSPQVLPIPIEQEISRVKEAAESFDSFDPGNSADSFSDQSFQGPSFTVAMQESSNQSIEMQADNSGNQSSSNMNFSQDDSTANPAKAPSSCPRCGKVFKYRTSMVNHFKHKHNPSSELHKCHICHQSFGWSSQLSNHLDTKHNVKKAYECSFCGRFFHHLSRAQMHASNFHPNSNVFIKHNSAS